MHNGFVPVLRPALCVALAGLPLVLSGCGGGLTRTLGLTRDAPDEFMVTTRAPLVVPSTLDLPPPNPGAPRPQEQPERLQAEQALVPQTALGTGPAPDSPGQEALVRLAGPPASPDIRKEVNAETNLDRPRQTLTERLMFWEPPLSPEWWWTRRKSCSGFARTRPWARVSNRATRPSFSPSGAACSAR